MATTKKTTPTATTTEKTIAEKTAKATPAAPAKPAKTMPAKKAAPKKTVPKKSAPKKPVAKTTPSQTSVKMFVEFGGVQVSIDKVIEDVKATYGKDAKEITIYLKPEESKAYFVADGNEMDMDVFFC